MFAPSRRFSHQILGLPVIQNVSAGRHESCFESIKHKSSQRSKKLLRIAWRDRAFNFSEPLLLMGLAPVAAISSDSDAPESLTESESEEGEGAARLLPDSARFGFLRGLSSPDASAVCLLLFSLPTLPAVTAAPRAS
jgi:hypothetical protein